MATPHLCKTDLGSGSGRGAARYPLISDGSDLLIIRKKTTWSGREMVVTPIEQKFCTAVAYGKSSYYNNTGTGARDDGVSLNNTMKQYWASMGSAAWVDGYKPLMIYNARGGCPYMIRNSSDYANQPYYLEMGSVRRALRFQCYCLPAGSCSSFKAYLRFWNPSMVQGMQALAKGSAYIRNFSYNKSGYVSYHFDTDLCAPNQIEADGYGQARFASDYTEAGASYLANEGRNVSGDVATSTTTYDPWDTRDANGRSTYYGYTRCEVYKHYDSSSKKYTTDPYYADWEITGDALTALKECMKHKTFWMHIGFHQGSMVYQEGTSGYVGMACDSTIMGYSSRVELILNASWSASN